MVFRLPFLTAIVLVLYVTDLEYTVRSLIFIKYIFPFVDFHQEP